MTSYEVPVIVTVTVEVDDDNIATVRGAGVDPEGGPWPFSSELAAWDGEEWHEGLSWPSYNPDDAPSSAAIAAEAAYDALRVSVAVEATVREAVR